MGKSREEFEIAIGNLRSSKSEEEILEYLTFIVKGFCVSLYKDIILENPYYKDLFLDIRKDVLLDLQNLRETIEEEMLSIEGEIKKSNQPKLRELKGDCISLIYEVDRKILEIESILL